MTTKLKLHLLLLLTLLSLPGLAHAQGTAIGYQGRLNDGGLPATGLYDFTFNVFDVEAAGAVLTVPVELNAVPVTNGGFNVSLDFGPDIFTGPARWLEITVRTNGVGAPSLLTPRTPLLPTPYAIFAGKAGSVANGTVTADQLNSGGVPPTPGQFLSYAGGNFLWTDPGVAAGNIWSLNGLDAYYNAGNVGIGTANPQNKLHVYDPAVSVSQRIETGGGTNAWAQTEYANANGLWKVGTSRGYNGDQLYFARQGAAGIAFGLQPNGDAFLSGAVNMTGGSSGSVIVGSPNGESGLSIIRGGNRADVRFEGTTLKLVVGPVGGPPASTRGVAINTAGNVGLGTVNPEAKLHVESSGVVETIIKSVDERAILNLDSTLGGQRRVWTVENGVFGAPGLFSIYDRTANRTGLTIDTAGVVSVHVLRITGGADLAEPFPMKEQALAKGSVVVIDDEHPGQLKLSAEAYDTRVAGIISGANGINPGIALHQEGVLDGGQNVALSGRVYVQADAAFGAIKPGDLLTTSNTPGHAMKVTEHGKAQGAILGKAMSGLKEGKGMVLVLVTLQ